MEGERISREQQELCQQLGEHGKLPSTLQVRGVLTVDQRPRRSRLCTLLGPGTSMTLEDCLGACTYYISAFFSALTLQHVLWQIRGIWA